MISDREIDEVLATAIHCFEKTAMFRGALRKKYFREELHAALHNTQSGVIEGSCHNCLGTGYEPNPQFRR